MLSTQLWVSQDWLYFSVPERVTNSVTGTSAAIIK